MINYIIGLIVLVILAAAIRYIVKTKKQGGACIGCPSASKCGKCHCHDL